MMVLPHFATTTLNAIYGIEAVCNKMTWIFERNATPSDPQRIKLPIHALQLEGKPLY